jgi:hypothetical protein
MKNLLVSMIIVLAGSSARAEEPTNLQLCEFLGEFAAQTMANYHDGRPLSKALSAVIGNPAESILSAIIMLAYGEPKYSSPSYQKRSIDGFRNEAELGCMRMMN